MRTTPTRYKTMAELIERTQWEDYEELGLLPKREPANPGRRGKVTRLARQDKVGNHDHVDELTQRFRRRG